MARVGGSSLAVFFHPFFFFVFFAGIWRVGRPVPTASYMVKDAVRGSDWRGGAVNWVRLQALPVSADEGYRRCSGRLVSGSRKGIASPRVPAAMFVSGLGPMCD